MLEAITMLDLLEATESDGRANRVEVVRLPHDRQLQDRFAFVVAGPHAAAIISMIAQYLDHATTRVAAQPPVGEAHGPETGAGRPN